MILIMFTNKYIIIFVNFTISTNDFYDKKKFLKCQDLRVIKLGKKLKNTVKRYTYVQYIKVYKNYRIN